jgi:hypothetical protein
MPEQMNQYVVTVMGLWVSVTDLDELECSLRAMEKYIKTLETAIWRVGQRGECRESVNDMVEIIERERERLSSMLLDWRWRMNEDQRKKEDEPSEEGP